MRGVGKDTVVQVLSAIVAIGGYVKFERDVLNKHCLDEQGKRGQNVPLRYNCANSIGAANSLFN